MNDQDRKFSFGMVGAGRDEAVEVIFADGQHVLGAHIVQKLGGRAQVEQKANELRLLSYAQFLAAFEQENTRQQLNQYARNFIRRW